MASQAYNWTCSVCSVTWALQAIGSVDPSLDVYAARQQVGSVMGYPNCVNPTYGCMSSDCVVNTFRSYGLNAKQAWVTYDQAYSICSKYTGVINPQGMYHFMGIRGLDNGAIWVANSAPGYDGVYEILDRATFNALGPVQVIALETYI